MTDISLDKFSQRLSITVGPIGWHKVFQYDDYKVIMATTDRTPHADLKEIDALIQQAFQVPSYEPGDHVVQIAMGNRAHLWFYAIAGSKVIAVSAVHLRTFRAPGMGMNDETRQAVFEFSTMYTTPEHRNKGIAAKLTELRLSEGVPKIISMIEAAVEEGADLEHEQDGVNAPDLEFNPDTLVKALKGPNAIIRAVFEDLKHQLRVERIAKQLDFGPSDASKQLMKRTMGEIVVVKETGKETASLHTGLNYPRVV